MSFRIAKPSDFLSPFIKQYWTLDNCLATGESHVQRIIPTGLMELSFYFGNIPSSLDIKKELTERSLVTGQLNESYDLVIKGDLSIFSITFQPQGAMMFFNLPLIELVDLLIPWRYVQKDFAKDIEEKLAEKTCFSERISIIEEFFSKVLSKKRNVFNGARMSNTITSINESKGMLSIESLASQSCLSRKQFKRVFQNSIGVSPKKFLKTVRFQNTLYQKQNNKDINLTSLAHECGYYDQSHMISDFKYLSGKTPSQYFSECSPFSDYFS